MQLFTCHKIYLHGFTLTCHVFYSYTYMTVKRPHTFTWSVNKFHYNIYIYMECKSQTMFTHKIGTNLSIKCEKRWVVVAWTTHLLGMCISFFVHFALGFCNVRLFDGFFHVVHVICWSCKVLGFKHLHKEFEQIV